MNICIFASSCDVGKGIAKSVYDLGRRLGEEGHALVFGGYGGGLMGAIADGFHDAGAKIIGVIPGFLEEKTENYPHLTQIIRTKELSDRKDEMIALSDAFIAVPGGIGTMDELCSILAMKASKRLDKDILIYNVDGFFDGLLSFFHQMELGGYLYSDLNGLYRVEDVKTAESR